MKTVFIIDDENGVREAVSEIFENSGFQTQSFANWEDAELQLRTHKPDLMLLDLNLPGISGIDALDKIQEIHTSLPILVVSATNDLDTAVHCMKNGASDYLSKPVSMEQLLDRSKLLLKLNAPKSIDSDKNKFPLEHWQNFLSHKPRQIVEPSLANHFYEVLVIQKEFLNPEISLALISDALLSNTTYVSKIANELFGLSFRKLVNSLRIAYLAQEWARFQQENLSMEGIANQLGFKHKGTFYDVFKSEVGMSPTEWIALLNLHKI